MIKVSIAMSKLVVKEFHFARERTPLPRLVQFDMKFRSGDPLMET